MGKDYVALCVSCGVVRSFASLYATRSVLADLVRDWIADGLDVQRMTPAEWEALGGVQPHKEGCSYAPPQRRGRRCL